MKVIFEQNVGAGKFWMVNRLLFEEKAIIDSRPYKQAIFKRCLESNNSESIKRNLANYSLINDSGLPTLRFYKIWDFIGDVGILGEDLNSCDKITFVSPSNANHVLAAKEVPSFLCPQKLILMPAAEAFLYKKVGSIANFKKLIEEFYRDMKLTEKRKILLFEDAFFFGFSHQDCRVCYKIADFDNIETSKDEKDVYSLNLEQILQAFYLFILRFVKESQVRKEYERKMLDLMHQNKKKIID